MKIYDEIIHFSEQLYIEEKSENTINKYVRDVKVFCEYANKSLCSSDEFMNKSFVMKYKSFLREKYNIVSANSMIASINAFFKFIDRLDLCVKQFKIQKSAFCDKSKELSFEEYNRLVETALAYGNERLSLVLQTICATGIRISELQYITVDAVDLGHVSVSLKNKTRTVFLVKKLRRKLKEYIKANKIKKGSVFVTKNGKPLDRTNIWREMKNLCKKANVEESKVFPHNLRHLFARAFYEKEKDIAKLADILGHSSINTTRIYIITSGDEHLRRMECMRLVI